MEPRHDRDHRVAKVGITVERGVQLAVRAFAANAEFVAHGAEPPLVLLVVGTVQGVALRLFERLVGSRLMRDGGEKERGERKSRDLHD